MRQIEIAKLIDSKQDTYKTWKPFVVISDLFSSQHIDTSHLVISVFPRCRLVHLATLFADHEGWLASVAALPSFGKIEFSRLASGLADFARVVTSDFAGDCANCGYH